MNYKDIEGIYELLKLNGLFLMVWTLCVLVAMGITLYKIGKNLKKTMIDNESIKPKDFINALMPFIPYYLVIFAIPLFSALFNSATDYLVDAVENARPENDFSQLDKPLQDYIDNKDEEIDSYTLKVGDLKIEIKNPIEEAIIMVEDAFLSLTTLVSSYLYTFALSTYFVWLLILEALSPIAALGFFYPEFKQYTQSFFKNMLACKMFLVLLAVSNLFSVKLYEIYMESSTWLGNEQSILITPTSVMVVFVLFRAYLYKKSWELSNKLF